MKKPKTNPQGGHEGKEKKETGRENRDDWPGARQSIHKRNRGEAARLRTRRVEASRSDRFPDPLGLRRRTARLPSPETDLRNERPRGVVIHRRPDRLLPLPV